MGHVKINKVQMNNHRYNQRMSKVKPQNTNEAWRRAWDSGRVSFDQMPKQAQQYTEQQLREI